jgi:hypothetical protein
MENAPPTSTEVVRFSGAMFFAIDESIRKEWR